MSPRPTWEDTSRPSCVFFQARGLIVVGQRLAPLSKTRFEVENHRIFPLWRRFVFHARVLLIARETHRTARLRHIRFARGVPLAMWDMLQRGWEVSGAPRHHGQWRANKPPRHGLPLFGGVRLRYTATADHGVESMKGMVWPSLQPGRRRNEFTLSSSVSRRERDWSQLWKLAECSRKRLTDSSRGWPRHLPRAKLALMRRRLEQEWRL